MMLDYIAPAAKQSREDNDFATFAVADIMETAGRVVARKWRRR
jgi:hypothetical protein